MRYLMICLWVFAASSLSAGGPEMKKETKAHKRFQKNFPAYQWIPEGNYPIDGRIQTLGGHYMLGTEITNLNWMEFVHYIREAFGEDSAAALLPASGLWTSLDSSFSVYEQYYYSHPAYHEYPVVNVSHAQAEAYCRWITGYLNGMEHVPFARVEFRLPTAEEWEYAAAGGLLQPLYAWGTPFVMDEEGRPMGRFLNVDPARMRRDAEGNLVVDPEEPPLPGPMLGPDLQSPVLSFSPNDYGLYNMSGNVAEFVAEDGLTKGGSWYDPGYYMRLDSEQHYETGESASPTRGFRIVMEVVEY